MCKATGICAIRRPLFLVVYGWGEIEADYMQSLSLKNTYLRPIADGNNQVIKWSVFCTTSLLPKIK